MDHLPTVSSWYNRNVLVLLILIFLGVGIFSQVFTADYLYLDEAYQLWNRDTNSNYHLFAANGRLFSGIYFQKAYSLISTIEEVRWLRIISLAGWIFCSWLLFYFSKHWCRKLGLPGSLPFLLSVFCICSSSVTIYVAWSSCAQVFLSFIAGLLSGHILFTILTDPSRSRFNITWSIILGIISLLFYQVMYCSFVLPFLLVWIANKIPGKRKLLATGMIVFFSTFLIYYLVFLFYRNALHTPHDSRTAVVFQPLKKLGFFFGTPFSQAWSFNMLVNLHNIFSQILPFAIFAGWLILFIKQSNPRKTQSVLIRLAGIILILICSYLPSVIAKENFSSYRTMIVLNLSVFILFSSAVLTELNNEKKRQVFIIGLSLLLFLVAFFNYNRKFAKPLRRELATLQQLPVIRQAKQHDTIFFIRPDAKLFQQLNNVKSYKDEFGLPSTYRDWVPENLTRQLIEEINSREVAVGITFYQFADSMAYRDSMNPKPLKPIIIDMNEVLKSKIRSF